ncbi:hypothetical protein Gotur_029299 [Gossypium turneri]
MCGARRHMFMEIYASLRKRTGLWEIKKYKGLHPCAADHPKMDSAMLASLILPTIKADPKTSVPVLIANIRSQMGYTPSYRKAWIAKQKALEKMHSRWYKLIVPSCSVGILIGYCLQWHRMAVGEFFQLHLQ